MVDTEETGQVQKETESTEETKELIIETETENGVESGKQEIQQTPEKTEDEKPEEPPALTEDADTTKPDTPPEYEEPEGTKPLVDDTPKTGDTKDGMIYIEGFGWVVDNGGGGSGTVADDMYENGNKVGIMDQGYQERGTAKNAVLFSCRNLLATAGDFLHLEGRQHEKI